MLLEIFVDIVLSVGLGVCGVVIGVDFYFGYWWVGMMVDLVWLGEVWGIWIDFVELFDNGVDKIFLICICKVIVDGVMDVVKVLLG